MDQTGEGEESTATHWVEADTDKDFQRGRCLAAARKAPGATAAEIAETTGMGLYVPSRRLTELREAGLLRNGRSRPCRVTRRLSLTWYPVRERGGVGTSR